MSSRFWHQIGTRWAVQRSSRGRSAPTEAPPLSPVGCGDQRGCDWGRPFGCDRPGSGRTSSPGGYTELATSGGCSLVSSAAIPVRPVGVPPRCPTVARYQRVLLKAHRKSLSDENTSFMINSRIRGRNDR